MANDGGIGAIGGVWWHKCGQKVTSFIDPPLSGVCSWCANEQVIKILLRCFLYQRGATTAQNAN